MRHRRMAGIVLGSILLLATYLYMRHITPSGDAHAEPPATPSVGTAQTLPDFKKDSTGKTWACPMHPEIMQDHPGTCPICGMKLVELKGHAGHDRSVQVDASSIQKLGVRLVSVKQAMVSQEIRAYGNVAFAESRLYNVHSSFDGLVKRSYIHSVGQQIKKGQVIYEIYAPDLIQQQNDYLKFVARRNQILKTVGNITLKEDEYVMDLLQELSRERTRFLHENVGIESVRKLEDEKQSIVVVPIIAAESGVVTQINMREGSFISPATTLFTLADVTKVWVDITLYPDQASQVKSGDSVILHGDYGQPVEAKISFINPLAETGKIKARVELDNGKLHLRPGAFVVATIHAQPHDALVLPRSAVLYGGLGNRVMLSRGEGRFLPVPVELGPENGDSVEILEGLEEGAEVAANGQFLLDAAASMQAAAERMHAHQP